MFENITASHTKHLQNVQADISKLQEDIRNVGGASLKHETMQALKAYEAERHRLEDLIDKERLADDDVSVKHRNSKMNSSETVFLERLIGDLRNKRTLHPLVEHTINQPPTPDAEGAVVMDSIGPVKLHKPSLVMPKKANTLDLHDYDDGDFEHPKEGAIGEVKVAASKHLNVQEALSKEQKAMEAARDAYVALDSKLSTSKNLGDRLNAALRLSVKLQKLVTLCKRQEHEAFNVGYPVVGATDSQKEKYTHLGKV